MSLLGLVNQHYACVLYNQVACYMALMGLVNQHFAWMLCNAFWSAGIGILTFYVRVVQGAPSDLPFGSAGLGKSTLCLGVVQGAARDWLIGVCWAW